MFTGIIQKLGEVGELKRAGDVYKLSVAAGDITKAANIGDSIAVGGVCLTVTNVSGGEVVFEIMEESFRKTNLGRLRKGGKVNLETSLKAGDRLSGHMVSGHIDGTGFIKHIKKESRTCRIEIEFPEEFKKYIVPKGSIAVDGVSLTVGEAGRNWFSIYIIPHTFKSTGFSFIKVKDPVNIELDLMAKYAHAHTVQKEAITEGFLKNQGFM